MNLKNDTRKMGKAHVHPRENTRAAIQLSAATSACRLQDLFSSLRWSIIPEQQIKHTELPRISDSRLAAARNAETLKVELKEDEKTTFLYLAYGSNLCHETFEGRRGIRPLSAVNVVVPTLRMTFDLPGIPYLEPCMGNSAVRDPDASSSKSAFQVVDYHKDRWLKGMVGVVYEVTASDYAHIIATEGGGASYHDILVPCYPLADGEDRVPEVPTSEPFRSHTLFAPAANEYRRPDPSYAQPSARYLKLITDGAYEHALPGEYKDYLQSIRPYEARTQRQKLGVFVFETLWLPFLMFVMALMQRYQNEDGTVPNWVASLAAHIFKAVWVSYDTIFKPIFGDGERTDYSKKVDGKGDEESGGPG